MQDHLSVSAGLDFLSERKLVSAATSRGTFIVSPIKEKAVAVFSLAHVARV